MRQKDAQSVSETQKRSKKQADREEEESTLQAAPPKQCTKQQFTTQVSRMDRENEKMPHRMIVYRPKQIRPLSNKLRQIPLHIFQRGKCRLRLGLLQEPILLLPADTPEQYPNAFPSAL